MYFNSKIALIILLHQCILINCNVTHNHTTSEDHIEQQTNIEEASGFVIYRRNVHDVVEYLLLQASHGDCHYSPPKGRVKGSEGYMDTALRETEEETGIKEDDLDVDYIYQKIISYVPPPNGIPKEDIYWLARLINPNKPIKLNHEYKAYAWLSIEEALKKVHPGMQKLLLECGMRIRQTKYTKTIT